MSVTTATAYRCANSERLAAVRNKAGLNGIEAVELVVPAGPLTELPRSLRVLFVKDVDEVPAADAFRIDGGSSGGGLRVVAAKATHDPRTLQLDLEAPGDLTVYELRLVDPGGSGGPPAGIDPVLGRCRFSFAVVCQTDADCLDRPACPPSPVDNPRLDRLARDYPGLRRLLLDRLAVLDPTWQQGNPADVRVALVEALAYVGDQLSYQQDAVATEAYLGTARSRVSVRRHARLVDYHMHDGLSARALLQLRITAGVAAIADGPIEAAGGTFLTAPEGQALTFDATDTGGRRRLDTRRRSGDQVFHIVESDNDGNAVAAIAPAVFSPGHNEMRFHTWSGDECCLPAGATRATLAGSFPDLAPGDVLVLTEHRSPITLAEADAEPTHRYPVRLTAVDAGVAGSPLTDPATDDPITEITWDTDDALPATLVVSAHGHDDVGVALGNIVLVEHGHREPSETLTIPDGGRPWRPSLVATGLSQSAAVPDATLSVAGIRAASAQARDARPQVVLDAGGVIWDARRDLIGAGDQTQFVAEVDNDGRVSLRFGRPENDGTFRHGRTPADTDGSPTMEARYRTGVGPAGNVGAGAIRRIVQTGGSGDDLSATLAAAVESIGNPLPAWGGVDPEPIEDVRQIAPFAFAVQERAVTAADYARRAEQFRSATFGGVQRAVARMRWTGAWYTVFVAVDRTNGVPIDDAFEQELRLYLDRYRMSGHDIEIEGAVDVPLEITLEVTVERSAFRSVVLAELRDVLSNRRLVDGRTGLFHPDRLTFAQTVHLSPILAEAQAVPGVIGVRCIRFGPYRRPTIELRDTGYLEVGRNEIARLDNDPSRPDRGVLTLTLIGGR